MKYLLLTDHILEAIDMHFKESCNVYNASSKKMCRRDSFISSDNEYILIVEELEVDELYTVDFYKYGNITREMIFCIITSDVNDLIKSLLKIDYKTRRIFISNLLQDYEYFQ